MSDKPVPPGSPASMAFYEITERIKRDAAASCKAADDAISASRKLLDKKDAKVVMNGSERIISPKGFSEWVKEVEGTAAKQQTTTPAEGTPSKPPDAQPSED